VHESPGNHTFSRCVHGTRTSLESIDKSRFEITFRSSAPEPRQWGFEKQPQAHVGAFVQQVTGAQEEGADLCPAVKPA
jgi:hypothetical protein